MDYPRFRSLIYHSSEQYLTYLNEQFNKGVHSAGRNVVPVWEIRPGNLPTDLYLTTAERIIQPDHCQIWIRGNRMDNIRILQVLKSEGRTHTILIRDEGDSLKGFGKLYPHDIQIISDMTFLIRRLRDFYMKHEFSFTPPMPEPVPELPEQFTQGLSEEQCNAVNGVFSAPVSYINGAPGTGKTRMVLSRCVLRYILDGKRVFLLAPTNNAVEQMLRSILPVLKESGIDLEKVYRIGTSTEEFAKEYPQVTADTSADTLRENLLEQFKYLDERIEQSRQYKAVADTLRQEVTQIKAANQKVIELFPKVIALQDSHEQAQQLLQTTKAALVESEQTHTASIEAQTDLYTQIDSHEQKIAAINALAGKLSYRLFRKEERMRLIGESAKLSLELSGLRQQLLTAQAHLTNCIEALRSAKARYTEAESNLKNVRFDLSLGVKLLKAATSLNPDYQETVRLALKDQSDIVQVLSDYLEKHQSVLTATEEKERQYPLTALKQERDSIQHRLDQIGVSAKQLQRQNALVYAGTIDASLKAMASDDLADKTIPVSHVFLDEAGYTSLARGMAAFACGAPVTFLGDHQQLPPICEMNRIQPNNAPVCLWALSIAYYHELVNGDFMELYNRCYCGEAEPSFRSLSRFSLNLSYRFGPELAAILARFIYDERFHGVAGAPFEIEVIDAPYTPGPYKRSSLSEVSGIAQYIKAHPGQNIAILAPYRGQIKLLRENLPPECKDSILTVHRSQGREWDTVILSVVDGRSPYFVDSNLPIGRAVLNTAISRTRRKLILVCDASTWAKKQNQIITSLIEQAQAHRLPS